MMSSQHSDDCEIIVQLHDFFPFHTYEEQVRQLIIIQCSITLEKSVK